MINKISRLLPPDFCDVITILKRNKDGTYKPQRVSGGKFAPIKADFSEYICKHTEYSFFARIPLGKCAAEPGDILVKGAVYDTFKKEENGEDILKKYPHTAFRAKTVSFCGNHIYVKG